VSSEIHSREALSIQNKQRFYFLSLVFVTLSFSIQSFSPYANHYFHYIEIASWFLFLISGFIGLSFVEWSAFLHIKIANIKNYEEGKSGTEKLLPQVQNKTEAYSYIEKLKDLISKNEESYDYLEKRNIVRYKIHKWGFFIGLILLLISRSFGHIQTGPMEENIKPDIFIYLVEKDDISNIELYKRIQVGSQGLSHSIQELGIDLNRLNIIIGGQKFLAQFSQSLFRGFIPQSFPWTLI
jgi:hypothetical protein